MAECLFCLIVKGEIPCLKLYESEKTLAFLDIGPLSQGHTLVIPKCHGAKLTDIPDDYLAEILPVLKYLAKTLGAVDYNLLQNNGAVAHQHVEHVHFHLIPKPDSTTGLGIHWPRQTPEKAELMKFYEDLKARM